MNIAYICVDTGIPLFGHKGASNHVRDFVRALSAGGHRVTVFSANIDGAENDDLPPSVPIVSVLKINFDLAGDLNGELSALSCNDSLRDLLEQRHELEPFDFVYERYSLWSLAARTFSHKHKLPFVLEVNSPLRIEQKKYRHLHLDTLASQIEQVLFHQSDWIVTVSSAVLQYVLETSHRTLPTLLLPNGVDLDLFRSVRGTPEDSPFTIGFVGSLKPWHGIDVLLEAFRVLAAESDTYRLLVVGDGPLASWIQKFVGQHDLNSKVTCVGGVEKRRIPELLCQMHVAVAPYPPLDDFYFSPLKIFEYMAAGRAIVASRIGQVADILRDEETALLAEPGSITNLVEKIRRLRMEPGIRLSLGRSAKAEAFRKHGWSNRVQDLIDAIGISGAAAGRGSASPRTAAGASMCRDLIASLGISAADGS